MHDDAWWYTSWGGLILLTIVYEIVELYADDKKDAASHAATMHVSRVVFAVIAGFATFMSGFPLPWAAVTGLLVYGVLRGDLTMRVAMINLEKLAGAPLELILSAFSAACVLQIVALPVTAAMPVFVGAIAYFGTACRGAPLILAQAWVPMAIAWAFVPHDRMYYMLAVLLAVTGTWGIIGQRLDFVDATGNRYANLIACCVKSAVLLAVLIVFGPFDPKPETFGHAVSHEQPPCVRRNGDSFTTDAQGTRCVQYNNECPLSYNYLAQEVLVCGGIGQGVCVKLDDRQNVCHCEIGYCGDVRYFPQHQRYFYVGCSQSFLALYGQSMCNHSGQPPNDLPESVGDRDLRPEFACRCVCDDVGFVGPLCNATCPINPGGDKDVCSGYPCFYNASNGRGACDCLGQAKGGACDQEACNGHGEINDAGGCDCDLGWGGNLCTIQCASTCNGRGVCLPSGKCGCAPGWLPPDCARCDTNDLSSDACGPNGVCVAGKCVCTQPNLSSKSDCRQCIDKEADPADCEKCGEGFYNDSTGCAPCTTCLFANCSADGQHYKCDCPEGFSGPNCACPPECSATGGTCDEKGQCQCDGKCTNADNTCADTCDDTDPCEGGIAQGAYCCEARTGRCRCNKDPTTGQCAAPDEQFTV